MVIKWLISKGLTPELAQIVAIVASVVLAVSALAGLKYAYDSRIISHHDTKVENQVLKKKARADDVAASTRAKDTIELEKQSQERTDAISKAPDEAPSAADTALNCDRLRRAGYDTSAFPSCR